MNAERSAPTASTPSPAVARVAGDYRLLRRLGRGAMGEVWLGRHRVTQGLAAVKILAADTQNRHARDALVREMRALARLHHPNIVALYEVGDAHLVMAFVRGTNLARRMRAPLDVAAALSITRQVASALAHAHAAGVVHRDVKPSNILLNAAGDALLADFGIASLTDTGTAGEQVGTPAYWSPEQARGEPAGPAADQYALARTLLALLSGRQPTRHEDPLASLPEAAPPALRAVLAQATAPAPEDRFPSMDLFDAALAALDLRGYAPPVPPASTVRDPTAFAWSRGAVGVRAVGAVLSRADHRLSALQAGGHLPAAGCEAFRARTGYAELGWSMFCHTGPLGPVTAPEALARATVVVVFLHGFMCDRENWAEIAAAVCRDNARAVVLVPDVLGFGESVFARGAPAGAQATACGLVDAMRAWLDLLGVSRDVPTVLVGHSMGAVAVLARDDDAFGPDVHRVAITPVFPSLDSPYRRALRVLAAALRTVGAFEAGMRVLTAALIDRSPHTALYAPAERARMARLFMNIQGSVLARLADGFAASVPAPGEALHRCVIVVGRDDPLASEETVAEAVACLSLAPDRVIHMSSGGHYPHAESATNPEWSARNVDEIVRVILDLVEAAPGPRGASLASGPRLRPEIFDTPDAEDPDDVSTVVTHDEP